MFKAPPKVKIGKYTYTIKHDPALRSSLLGHISYASRTIQLTTKRIANAELSEVFWHEVTHGILHDMRSPLAYNERFVTAFGKRLNDAVRSVHK